MAGGLDGPLPKYFWTNRVTRINIKLPCPSYYCFDVFLGIDMIYLCSECWLLEHCIVVCMKMTAMRGQCICTFSLKLHSEEPESTAPTSTEVGGSSIEPTYDE